MLKEIDKIPPPNIKNLNLKKVNNQVVLCYGDDVLPCQYSLRLSSEPDDASYVDVKFIVHDRFDINE